MKTPTKPAKKTGAHPKQNEWDNSGAVDEFMGKLKHPLKPALEAIRAIIRESDSRVTEGIKWNAPSFYFKEWFATAIIWRGKDSILIVLHKGAKVKDNTSVMNIEDKSGLLEWAAKERALVKFNSLEEVNSKKGALQSIVRQWVEQMT